LGSGELNFIKNKILESGFPLEFYVSSVLSTSGWRVYPNSYFLDKDEMKGRELDIKAESDEIEIETSQGYVGIKIFLLIECKKIPGNAWIFFKVPSSSFAPQLSYSMFDFLFQRTDDISYTSSSYGDIRANHEMPTHFDNFFVSESHLAFTNYTEIIVNEKESNKRTDNLWSSIITLVKAISQTQQDFFAVYEFEEKEGYLRQSVQKGGYLQDTIKFIFPVIVFEGKMVEAVYKQGDIQLKNCDYVPLNINYKSGNYEGEYFIEIVHKTFFEEYFKTIENDREILKIRAKKYSEGYLKELKEALKRYFSTKSSGDISIA